MWDCANLVEAQQVHQVNVTSVKSRFFQATNQVQNSSNREWRDERFIFYWNGLIDASLFVIKLRWVSSWLLLRNLSINSINVIIHGVVKVSYFPQFNIHGESGFISSIWNAGSHGPKLLVSDNAARSVIRTLPNI